MRNIYILAVIGLFSLLGCAEGDKKKTTKREVVNQGETSTQLPEQRNNNSNDVTAGTTTPTAQGKTSPSKPSSTGGSSSTTSGGGSYSGGGGSGSSKFSNRSGNTGAKLSGQALIMKKRFATIPVKDIFKNTEDKPFKNDYTPPANLTSTENVKNVALIRNYHTPVQNQGTEGACSAFATSHASEVLIQKMFMSDHIRTNAFTLWNQYKEPNGNSALIAAREGNIKTLDASDNVTKEFKIKKHLHLFTTTDMMDQLDKGNPLIMATLTNVTWYTAYFNDGFMECRSDADSDQTGHLVAILGYALGSQWEGGGVWIIKNSWGQRFGDLGFGYLPFGCCEKVRCWVEAIQEVEQK